VVLCDQNFPAVLPSASGKCVAIMRIEHGTLKDLVELIEKVAPPPDSGWDNFFAWFANSPAEGRTAELLCIRGEIWSQTGQLISGYRNGFLHPPPPWEGAPIRNWYDPFWTAATGWMELRVTQQRKQ
jgi:hypothetical protein